MNKELKISMKFDTSDAEAAADKMYKKMKQIADLSKGSTAGQTGGPSAGPGDAGMFNKPGMESFFKSMDALRKGQDSAMRNHAKEQMKLMKDIYKEEERRGKLIQDQEKLSKSKTKDLQEELRIKKDLKTTEEQISRLSKEAGRGNSGMLAAKMASGGTQPVFVTNWPSGRGGGGGGGGGGPDEGGAGGGGGGGGGGFDIKKLMSMKGIQSLMGMAAIAAAAGVVKEYGGMAIKREASIGGAVESFAGNQLSELYGGNVITGMGWQKERQQAEAEAQKKMEADQISDTFLSGKSWMGSGSKLMQGVTSLGGKANNRVSDWFGSKGDDYFSALQAEQVQGKGAAFEESLAAQQKQAKEKSEALSYYQNRYQGDLQFQRTSGLSDQGLYGPKGMMQGAGKAGFTGDMAMQMAQGIQGAGGSTRGMGNATLGLQAQRGFGLTNASSILGSISGGAGDAGSSERIFKRILEEGVKNGLDKSESVEELRRFSQATAEVVAKSGTASGEDASRIIEGVSRFMNTQGGNIPTIKEEEGAKAAYEKYQTQSGQAGGRFGALQYASMTKEGLGKIGSKAMGALMQMPEGDLNADNDRIVAIAAANDMDPTDLAEKVRKAKSSARDVNVQFDPKNRDILKNSIGTGKQSYKQLRNASPEARRAYEESVLATSYSGYGGAQEAQAEAQGLRGGAVINPGTTGAGAGVDGRLTGGTGRMGDDATRALAASSQKALENFRDFKDVLVPSADAVSKLTGELKTMIEVIRNSSANDKAAAVQGTSQRLNQPQAGKPPGAR